MELQCSIGFASETKCHLQTYLKSITIESMTDLPIDTREILMWNKTKKTWISDGKENEDTDVDTDDIEIEFKQWAKVDRTELISTIVT